MSAATIKVIEATGLNVCWETINVGERVSKTSDVFLFKRILKSIQQNCVALKGPITTPVASGVGSLNVALRKSLNFYANL